MFRNFKRNFSCLVQRGVISKVTSELFRLVRAKRTQVKTMSLQETRQEQCRYRKPYNPIKLRSTKSPTQRLLQYHTGTIQASIPLEI